MQSSRAAKEKIAHLEKKREKEKDKKLFFLLDLIIMHVTFALMPFNEMRNSFFWEIETLSGGKLPVKVYTEDDIFFFFVKYLRNQLGYQIFFSFLFFFKPHLL